MLNTKKMDDTGKTKPPSLIDAAASNNFNGAALALHEDENCINEVDFFNQNALAVAITCLNEDFAFYLLDETNISVTNRNNSMLDSLDLAIQFGSEKLIGRLEKSWIKESRELPSNNNNVLIFKPNPK